MTRESYKPPIAVDWDGTIWDKENECFYFGAESFLRELNKKYYVIIFTSRATEIKDKAYVQKQIIEHKLAGVIKEVTNKKHLNFAHIIDNKAIKCCGNMDFDRVLTEVGL